MKVLTLWQPWASAVALGLKRIETRHWTTKYRGPLLIHAAKKWSVDQRIEHNRLAKIVRDDMIHVSQDDHDRFRERPPLGMIVAICRLEDCLPTTHYIENRPKFHPWVDRLSPIERAFGDYSFDRYGWKLTDIRRLEEPIPCIGSQGLFDPPPAVARELAGLNLVS